ncbi:MAG: aspartate--tRNA(Asn) ligase, partial [Candidatus Aenigmatarchaeota archaeon]
PESIDVLSKAETPLPIEIGDNIKTGLDKRLDFRFLDLRNPRHNAIFRIRSQMYKAAVDFFDDQGFTNINTPKITVAGVESGAELFPIVYFNREAFLSQSPQIYKQTMVAAGFERVYEIAPVFRAEKSHTTRHLTEFTGVDFEMGFIKDMHDVMDVNEGLMKHIIGHLLKKCPGELEMFGIKPKVPGKIPRITMDEAKKMLESGGKKLPADEDLDAEGEKMLGDIIKEKHGEDFVFVYNYPWKKRPFYHMKPEDNPNVTLSFDLIWNGVEIATGAQREHRYDVLKKQAKEKGINLDEMKDYSNIFKYGCPPHGGTGLGLDRLVECLLRLDNIREAILLPRDPERLTP